MSKKKKVSLFILIILALLLGVFLFLLYKDKKKTQPATLLPIKAGLNLVDTIPSPGKLQLFNPTIGISFCFDATLDLSSAMVNVSPHIPFKVNLGINNSNCFVVSPEGVWRRGTSYKIIVMKGLTSEDKKQELKEDVTYKIEFESPPEDIPQMPPPF